MKLVGIAGLPRSGKDTLAELLLQKGYYGVSLGDIVRDEARVRHQSEPDPISVKNMTETANWLRTNNGPDFALKQALERYEKANQSNAYVGLVVWSVRAPVEVDFILEHGGELIWVEASDEVRHDRGLKYMRPGEAPTTLEEFKAQEALQWQPNPDLPKDIQMNVSYVKSKATKVLENQTNDYEKFTKDALELLDNLDEQV